MAQIGGRQLKVGVRTVALLILPSELTGLSLCVSINKSR